MRVAYLGSADSWYFHDFQRAAQGRLDVRQMPFESLSATIHDGRTSVVSGEHILSECDAVIVRTMPAGSLEQIVMRMDLLVQLEMYGTRVVNPPRALEAAIDKLLTTSRLAAAEIPTPATHISQDWRYAMEGFRELGGDVVVKPLFGGEGRGITRISDEELAVRAFKMLAQMGAVIYQQRFIEHEGCDLRLLVLGDEVWGMKRCHAHDWRTNISRGAVGSPLEVTDILAHIARRAATSVGAVFAGVDILIGRDGQMWVLEVNGVPGWKALSQTLHLDVADALTRFLIDRR